MLCGSSQFATCCVLAPRNNKNPSQSGCCDGYSRFCLRQHRLAWTNWQPEPLPHLHRWQYSIAATLLASTNRIPQHSLRYLDIARCRLSNTNQLCAQDANEQVRADALWRVCEAVSPKTPVTVFEISFVQRFLELNSGDQSPGPARSADDISQRTGFRRDLFSAVNKFFIRIARSSKGKKVEAGYLAQVSEFASWFWNWCLTNLHPVRHHTHI